MARAAVGPGWGYDTPKADGQAYHVTKRAAVCSSIQRKYLLGSRNYTVWFGFEIC